MTFFFFEIIVCLIILNVIFMINFNNPVHSAISLIVTFLLTAGLLFFFGCEFLGFILILVYASGVSILFLFSVMLFNIKIERTSFFRSKSTLLSTIFFSIFFIGFSFLDFKELPITTLNNSDFALNLVMFQNSIENFSTLNNLSQYLYVDLFLHLLILGFLLFIVMLGILMLILPFNSKQKKHQSLFKQNARISLNSFIQIKKHEK